MHDEATARELIRANREFMKFDPTRSTGDESDQQLKRPQPPLSNPPRGGEPIALTREYSGIVRDDSYLSLLENRRSLRDYADRPITLDQLAFLLWSTQGVVQVRGKNYCTMRPVPSGGARHPFESYIAVRNVQELKSGIYHYLPLDHTLEPIGEITDFASTISNCLCGQKFAGNASAVFFYSVVPYRSEWRYGYEAHRVVLMDIGYVGQNLCLSSEAIGCGCCAVAAFDQRSCDALIGVDGEEEFTIFTAAVGPRK